MSATSCLHRDADEFATDEARRLYEIAEDAIFTSLYWFGDMLDHPEHEHEDYHDGVQYARCALTYLAASHAADAQPQAQPGRPSLGAS